MSLSEGKLKSIEVTIEHLRGKLDYIESSVAERLSTELGMPQEIWERSKDLRYLVSRAEELRSDPEAFIRRILEGVAPHLSSQEARDSLVFALGRVVALWDLERYPVEVAAQALEVAASDVRLHDEMQVSGYKPEVIESLIETQPEDSFAVGMRLKRNAMRKIQAVEGVKEAEALDPICRLDDLTWAGTKIACSRASKMDGFASLIITGGRGTRLRTSVPKALIPLGRRLLITCTIDALQDAGATSFAVVIGFKGELHRQALNDRLTFIEQREQRGTGHAVMAARLYFEDYEGPLLVCYSDMPFIRHETLNAMVEKHHSEKAAMTFLTTSREAHPEFGRVFRRDGRICGIGQVRFEATESNEVDAGFYCFEAPLFWKYLGRIQNANNRREFVLTEIVAQLAQDGRKVESSFVDDYEQTIGINRPAELVQARQIAYVRSRVGDWGQAEAELYWKLRFYETYGGVRADEALEPPCGPAQIDKGKSIVAMYDDAVAKEIGPIFSCPLFSRLLDQADERALPQKS